MKRVYAIYHEIPTKIGKATFNVLVPLGAEFRTKGAAEKYIKSKYYAFFIIEKYIPKEKR